MRVRKNVKNLTNSEKTAFVSAVLALKQQPGSLRPEIAGWSRYDDYAEVHMNSMMVVPGWAHRGPAFFPWHRELLLRFENDLVAIDPSVTIPYWDWPDPGSSPFTADLLGPDGDPASAGKVTSGPFAFDGPNQWKILSKDDPGDPDYLARSFGTDPTAMQLPTVSDVATSLNAVPYDSYPWTGATAGFRTSVESNLHNVVHRYISGTMGLMTSPNDPVFWLHHCNIDRLWAHWPTIHPASSPYLPVSGAALGHNLNDAMIFNDMGPQPWPVGATPASVIDHYLLGYRYDDEILFEKPRIPMSFVRVLFGVINDAPGVVIGADGKPHPVPGWPPDAWAVLREPERNELVGAAIQQMAELMPDRLAAREIRALIGKAVGARAVKATVSDEFLESVTGERR